MKPGKKIRFFSHSWLPGFQIKNLSVSDTARSSAMALLLHIPGYYDRSAARLERLQDYWRAFAFLGLNETLQIAGSHKIEIRQLTLRMFVQLCAVRSPFLVGSQIRPEHVAQILWRLSPDYDKRSANPNARETFVASIASFPFNATVRAIDRYLDRQLIDKPPTRAKQKNAAKPDTTFAASVIHALASEYGWSGEEILDLPIARIFQYLRKISRAADPEAPKFNPLVDKYKARVMSEYFAARKAAEPKIEFNEVAAIDLNRQGSSGELPLPY